MATDNRASTNLNDDERQGMRLNILRSIGDSNFDSGFGAAFNIDPEDRRDLLYTRREARAKHPSLRVPFRPSANTRWSTASGRWPQPQRTQPFGTRLVLSD